MKTTLLDSEVYVLKQNNYVQFDEAVNQYLEYLLNLNTPLDTIVPTFAEWLKTAF